MRPFVHRSLALICALFVSGAHWHALQTVAWTQMLVSRTQESTLTEAVITTFDGDHPCALCEAVEDGREQDKDKAPIVESLAKLNFLQPAQCVLPKPVWSGVRYQEGIRLSIARRDSPPSPPPRHS